MSFPGEEICTLCKNTEQVTLKVNFNFLLSIFKCRLHDKLPCDCVKKPQKNKTQDYTDRELGSVKKYIFPLPLIP